MIYHVRKLNKGAVIEKVMLAPFAEAVFKAPGMVYAVVGEDGKVAKHDDGAHKLYTRLDIALADAERSSLPVKQAA